MCPGGSARTPRRSEITPPGGKSRPILWSALIGLPGWIVVALVFWQALKQPTELVFSLLVWIGCFVVVGLATLGWSRYARRPGVHSRKIAASGRNQRTPSETLIQDEDALGRSIELDPKASKARVVRVKIERETKVLRKSR